MYMYYLPSYIHLHTQPIITGIRRTLKKREDRVWAIAEEDPYIPEWSDEEEGDEEEGGEEEGGEEREEEEKVRLVYLFPGYLYANSYCVFEAGAGNNKIV